MRPFYLSLNRVFFLFLTLSVFTAFANNPLYEQRRQNYITTSIASGLGENNILKAYSSLPLDTVELNVVLQNIATKTTSDFDIIELVRILFLTNGTYDAKILPILNSVPYWINNADTVRNYWSENHMIMWMSSDWLLHEKYGKVIDNHLDARLRHYLDLKVTYGFYEFFSSTYAPYALSGLLNLADFSQDAQIKDMATKASQRLLTDLMMLTNDKGTFFPTAGRNYTGKYINPYGQNHSNLIYLLTGMGETPIGASHGGAFLSTSTLPIDSVAASWKPRLDTLYTIGHSLDSGFTLNGGMHPVDKTVFQWSSGAYFHPKVILETTKLLADSNMWRHVDFDLLLPVSNLSPSLYVDIAEGLGVISKSSVICGQQLSIFKRNSLTLSSIRNFWKGHVGFQQFPCVANVGTTAVYTASGEVKNDWQQRNSNNANTHLPYVFQQKNVALLMYRPMLTPDFIGPNFAFKDVALHWRQAEFDETATDSLWLLGRQNESYVAVKRSCIGMKDSVWACETNVGQTWVLMVGDSSMYGSFANFKNVVHQAQFEEKWYMDSVNSQYVYYAKINVDNITIDHAWGVDSTLPNGILDPAKKGDLLKVYPNPTSHSLQVDLGYANQEKDIKIFNMNGKMILSEKSTSANTKILTSDFATGVYTILATYPDGKSSTARFVIQH